MMIKECSELIQQAYGTSKDIIGVKGKLNVII